MWIQFLIMNKQMASAHMQTQRGFKYLFSNSAENLC